MAQYQTADGRWIVGAVEGESDYHGFLGWRDCVIQLTASGATPESVNYLNAFKDYALTHNSLGEPIMPPSVNVWISNNGTTTAVQADDLSVDGNTFTIGGIKWTGSAWDYSNAGQGGGGGGSGGGGVLVVGLDTATFALDKTWQEIYDAMDNGQIAVIGYSTETGDALIAGRYIVVQALGQSGSYSVATLAVNINEVAVATFAASSADGYPVLQTG